MAKDEEMNITNVGDRHSNDNEGKPKASSDHPEDKAQSRHGTIQVC